MADKLIVMLEIRAYTTIACSYIMATISLQLFELILQNGPRHYHGKC